MATSISRPIAIVDEHPEWSARLIAELQSRRLPFEKIDHSSHAYDPRDRQPRYSVVVNRSSPSSHRRDHGSVLFYAEPLLAHLESLGIPVINPVAAYRFEKSKALQAQLFERLRIRSPRTVVLNHVDQIAKALDGFRFPVVIKPNVGGSGAGIVRFDSRAELEARLAEIDLGPDHVALLQEFIEAEGGAIVRIEVLDGRFLYAIRIVRGAGSFNLCPADLCQVPPAATPAVSAPARWTRRRRSRSPVTSRRRRDRARHRARSGCVDRRRRHRVPGVARRRPDLLLRRQRHVQLRGQRPGGAGLRSLPPVRGLHRARGARGQALRPP